MCTGMSITGSGNLHILVPTYTPQVSFLGHWWPLDVLELLYYPAEVCKVDPVAAHKESWDVPYHSSIPSWECTKSISVVWATPLLHEPILLSCWLHSELTAEIPHPKAFRLPCERGQSHQRTTSMVTIDKSFLESLWKVRGKFLERSQIFASFA